MSTTKERIETIQDNLAENDRAYRERGRSKKVWLTCKRDGKHRLAELRAQLAAEKRKPVAA